MESVVAPPVVRGSAAVPGRVTIRLRPVTADPLRLPALLVVDGVILGRRADGTVDMDAAQRALRSVDANLISSIETVKREPAMERFGSGPFEGALLITTRPATGREVPKP